MITVQAESLSKRYGEHTALDSLGFTAEASEVIGLLGPNGAGKTTAIRLLTTILRPSGGRFTVAGVPGDDPAAIRRRIGVLPESAGYPERQTGREYLTYAARLFGQSRTAARTAAGRLLAEVGLAERANTRISRYSRGMRQRLGIARALINDPAVVFLDEPTLGLDPAGQRQILAAVDRIAHLRGATVIVSTHTLTEVEQLCDRILVLDRGQLRAAGTIAEVVESTGCTGLAEAFLQLTGETARAEVIGHD